MEDGSLCHLLWFAYRSVGSSVFLPPPLGTGACTNFQAFFTSKSDGDSLLAESYPQLSPEEDQIVMETLR